MAKILLTGSGITSAICCSILKRELPNVNLVVWDKAKGTGGRMSTSRCAETGGMADDGAQYFTTTQDYIEKHSLYYSELKKNKLLMPLMCTIDGMKKFNEGTEHFVPPKGSSSIVKYFMESAEADIKSEYHISDVNDVNEKWRVKTNDGISDEFDVVILTIPVPQILQLNGALKDIIDSDNEMKENMKKVEYSSRFSLVLFFNHEQIVTLKENVAARYYSDDPIIRFVSIDNVKRGQNNESPSVVVHTSVPYGKENLETDLKDMQDILMDHIQNKFPKWPQPVAVKCHRWRYSQVSKAYAGLPGSVELSGGLIAGGDAFTGSNLDGCIESAESICRNVINYIKCN